MGRTLQTHIADAIKAKEDDTVVNILIQQHIDDFNLTVSVTQWRLDNYSQLRGWTYPSQFDYLDAKVKQTKVDKKEGEDQEIEYLAKCIAVKERFPKPTE
jgi:hypothetical protein